MEDTFLSHSLTAVGLDNGHLVRKQELNLAIRVKTAKGVIPMTWAPIENNAK